MISQRPKITSKTNNSKIVKPYSVLSLGFVKIPGCLGGAKAREISVNLDMRGGLNAKSNDQEK